MTPTIEVFSNGGPVDENATAILDCYSSRAETTKWVKDSYYIDLKSSDRVNLLPNGSLEIKEFREADNGEYYCFAINPTAQVASTAIYVGTVREYHNFQIVFSPASYPGAPLFSQKSVAVKNQAQKQHALETR